MLYFFVPFLLANLATDYYVWRHLKKGFPDWALAKRRTCYGFYVALQITWYVALPVVAAWGYEGLPAWFRNAFQTYVLMAVVSKVWALPWWLFKDILAFFSWIAFRLKKIYGDITTRESALLLLENKVNKGIMDVASISRADFLSRLGFVVGSIPLLGLGGSALSETAYRYKIHRLKITLKGLAPSWRGKRIVHLSDLHTGSWDDREAIQRGLDLVHSLHPDLIFFTGDLVNTRAAEVEPWMDLLAQIQAPLGVFSILGNHDYGDYTQWVDEDAKSSNFATMIATHRELGWKLLRNQWIPISNEAGDIMYLVGSENWGKRSGFGKQYGDLNQAMKGLPENSQTILLTHDPSHFDLEVLGKIPTIGLTLCGHTHGMQMGIEIPGFLRWSPASWVYPHWAGHYNFGDQQLYVNRGFGFVGFRGRLGIFPEITCLQLG
ncbi:MAG: hypothetical protein FJ350_06345 [Sphingomonadales bacterium]|nr:hypothetical protein [Sphingomonadales bacterium]MBM3931736.1 hypothetical protein [Sphingomonadales bacterium]